MISQKLIDGNPGGEIISVGESDAVAAAKAVEAIKKSAWAPPDRRSAWQWAEDHVKAIPYSPIPSRFRSDNSPWIREPLEALTDVKVRKVQTVAAIQSGKTFMTEIGSCYIVANLPGPMLWLDQKDEEAADELENRLKPLWASTPEVKKLVPGDTGQNRFKNKRNQVTFLNGMTAWVLGAHNNKNLQRRSIRWLLGDETWAWPKGHMKEAEARVTAFGWLGKIFLSSQAGEEDDDTDISFRLGTQEEWNFACNECGEVQPYLWENVEWSDDCKHPDGSYDYDKIEKSARIVCPHCGHEHDTSETRVRRKMNDPERGAKFIVMNRSAPSNYRSFHWNGLCATPIGTLATLYIQAKESAKKGDLTDLKIFYQKRLAMPWRDQYVDFKVEIEGSGYREGEIWDEEAIINRRGKVVSKPEMPNPTDFEVEEEFEAAQNSYSAKMRGSKPARMLKIDCQRDHFWATVTCFNSRGDQRLVYSGGGRSGDRSLLTWEDLDEIALKYKIPPRLVFVDAGHDTARVYMETAKRGWTSMMGDKRDMFPHRITAPDGKSKITVQRIYSSERVVTLGQGLQARVHYYSNLHVKDLLSRIINNQDPEEGITYEVPDDVSEEFLKQLDSERRIKKNGKPFWEQVGKRDNHFWDCECIGVAALVMLKLLGKDSFEEEIDKRKE